MYQTKWSMSDAGGAKHAKSLIVSARADASRPSGRYVAITGCIEERIHPSVGADGGMIATGHCALVTFVFEALGKYGSRGGKRCRKRKSSPFMPKE